MQEHAVYNSEDGKWYRQGDDPWTVRIVPQGSKLQPIFSVRADNVLEAFEDLFGYPLSMPAVTREARRSQDVN